MKILHNFLNWESVFFSVKDYDKILFAPYIFFFNSFLNLKKFIFPLKQLKFFFLILKLLKIIFFVFLNFIKNLFFVLKLLKKNQFYL